MNDFIKNNNIVKSNDLITASYNLTLQEQRLILSILAKYDQQKEIPLQCTLKASEFAKIFNGIKLDFYKELIKAVDLLYDRDIKYYDDQNRPIDRFRWVQRIQYDHHNSEVALEFANALKPYISQLRKQFTTYKLADIIKLKSVNSIRLFELIQQKYELGEFLIKIIDFRIMFKLDQKYPRFGDLRQWVIEPSLKEIFLKLNIKIDFKAIKNGRSYEYLQFTWEKNPNIPERLKITKVTNLDNPK